MRVKGECKPRSIRRKTPVISAARNSRDFTTCTVLQIERDKNVIVPHKLAENAQLRWGPRTLVVGDSVFLQNQPGRPSGQRLGHQGRRGQMIVSLRFNKIKYV